jgi:hypothetical protein
MDFTFHNKCYAERSNLAIKAFDVVLSDVMLTVTSLNVNVLTVVMLSFVAPLIKI